MTTYTDEEIEEYLIENGIFYANDTLFETAISNGFSFDSEINKWVAL